MRVLVCGTKCYQDRRDIMVFDALDRLHAKRGIDCVIQGACSGVDLLARLWAEDRGVACESYPAQWQHGRSAGPIRNQRMIDEGKPDGVIAFPGGKGTENMIRAAERAGLTVWRPRSAWQRPEGTQAWRMPDEAAYQTHRFVAKDRVTQGALVTEIAPSPVEGVCDPNGECDSPVMCRRAEAGADERSPAVWVPEVVGYTTRPRSVRTVPLNVSSSVTAFRRGGLNEPASAGSKVISKAAAWRLARMDRRLDMEHLAALRERGLV